MPYMVQSRCNHCDGQARFAIGHWPRDLGVYLCSTCKVPINVPLETGACPGCGVEPSIDDYYDHARVIPYMSVPLPADAPPGPVCPKCDEGALSFKIDSHYNVGRLGLPINGKTPWVRRDYMEKSIFAYALLAVAGHFKLDVKELLNYYTIDLPNPKGPNAKLLTERRLSMPILFDIRNHLLAQAMVGQLPFVQSPEMKAEVHRLEASLRPPE